MNMNSSYPTTMYEKYFTPNVCITGNKKIAIFTGWTISRIFEIIIFCFVVAICDLVHAVEAMYGLP